MQWHSRITAKLETHNGIFILENTIRFITLQINVLLIICLRSAGKELLSLIALSLSLDEDHFEKIGALSIPEVFLRLLHYPGLLISIFIFF